MGHQTPAIGGLATTAHNTSTRVLNFSTHLSDCPSLRNRPNLSLKSAKISQRASSCCLPSRRTARSSPPPPPPPPTRAASSFGIRRAGSSIHSQHLVLNRMRRLQKLLAVSPSDWQSGTSEWNELNAIILMGIRGNLVTLTALLCH